MSYQFFQNFDFSGGLNLRHQTAQLAPSECVLSQNWISNGKAIQILPGYTKYNDVPIAGNETKPIQSLFRFIQPLNPTVRSFIAQCNSSIWVADEVNRTWSELIGGINVDSVMEFVTHGDRFCFMVNGFNGLHKYDGTAVISVVNAPNGVTITGHYNRLMIAGDPEYPSRIYWSDPGMPDKWDTVNGFQQIPTVKGDAITKIIFFLDSTLIFKQHSIWRIQNNFEPFPVFNISNEIGCSAKKSVVIYGDKIFWLGSTGHIYCYDRTRIHNLTEEKIGSLPVAKDRMNNVVCTIVDDRLWVSYSDQNDNESYNNRLLIADITFINSPRWYGPHTGFNINSIIQFTDSGEVFFGDANTSTVWRKGNNYYMGKSFAGTTASSTATTITVLTNGEQIAENELTGCSIELTSGTGQGQKKIISGNTVFSVSENSLIGTITVIDEWTIEPSENTLWEIGAIDARYRTGILSLQAPERQKLFDKVFIHAGSAGNHYLGIEVIKNHLDYGNQYLYSLLGSATIWDSAIWDDSNFSSPDMLDNYVDLDFENAKYLNLEFSVKGRNLPALLYGYILMYQYGDLLNSGIL